ncbi:bifunctional diguanylate cyclase/phosphodiesterase [Petrocella sp. FN5]|uniref:bifunctional diguanylate cyclase/phosphodiesterase n=1 Tax=Petrocella sp. FN5 TaxID=3032002 RepID=UPI0023DCAC24|nr:EAL domain-containing protein [Petrocella sp. FN5]MDF1617881.1 EAL domain-containing protein [Petrocella sp. FN5]
MVKKLSIRNKLILSIFLGCLIPYFFGGLYIKNQAETWLYNKNIESTNTLLGQTADFVDETILIQTENLVSMMAKDERIIHEDGQLNSYVDYEAETFRRRSSVEERKVLALFRNMKQSHDILGLIAFGTEYGGYVEYPEFNPNAPYDPRIRPWYMNAIGTEGVIVSEPYRTSVTNELVISIAKNVKSGYTDIGVLSLVIRLDDLVTRMNNLSYGETGYVKVLSPSNKFINSPKHEDWILASIEELELDVFYDIDGYDGYSFEGQIDGEDKVFNVHISPYSGWKYIAIIDRNEVIAQSKVLTDALILIYFLTLLIILLFVSLISSYITRPILKIAGVINKMANFKFDAYEEDKDLISISHKKDEVGAITSALHDMQTNFVELSNNIYDMDEEIKNIAIGDKSRYSLSLSEDNPFVGITKSINNLLDKVYSYIDQIKSSQLEITNKNELLTASEEELTAQVEEIESQKAYIHFLADHDPLTELPNRRSFYKKLNQVLEADEKGAVMLLDLDNFKGINDTLGHLFGDQVLMFISRELEALASDRVFVSRFGGDEFLLLYMWTNGENELLEFIHHLNELFNRKLYIENNEVNIEFSMGISLFPSDSNDINQLIMNADLALYTIKNSGKNNYAFYSLGMGEYQIYKSKTEAILREAIDTDGFKMVYQPQVELSTGRVAGFEALLRLKNNKLSPGEFIPIAEDNGMIIAIGRIVTKLVVEQIRSWMERGYTIKPVAINYSAVQMYDYGYKAYLLNLLRENAVSPSHILIEITENIFLENKESTIAFLKGLRSHGIKIAIDDFGTGYSSLSYLTFLPIDTIKLDRSLSMEFLEMDNISVMDSLIALAHSLNLLVIAEGIEEQKQVKRLKYGKCDAIQGYYFSKPMEVEELEQEFDKKYEV